jgi:hypothetical protein
LLVALKNRFPLLEVHDKRCVHLAENEMERTMEELETQVWDKISSSLR